MMLKLAFQGWFLTQPHTGIGRHCKGLIEALQSTKKVQLTVLIPAPLPVEEVKALGLKKNQIHVLRPKKFLVHSALKKWFWEKVQAPAFFAKQNLDWEYYPYPCPLPKSAKHLRAMTVHDLIPWSDSRYQSNRLKKKYYKEALRTLIHMDQLFTVSKSTHTELGIPAAHLLPNAVSLPKIKSKRANLKDLVYVGGYELRKNVPKLIQRFEEFHKKNPEYRLLLIGKPHQKSKWYPELPKHSAVLELGSKSDVEVFERLSTAFAFVHASESEGFNLPLLEAMSAGTPAVVTDLPVNREVSKNTALFWNPSKKNSLESILKPLEDPAKRRAVILAQKKAAKSYSWNRTAKLFLEVLTSKL